MVTFKQITDLRAENPDGFTRLHEWIERTDWNERHDPVRVPFTQLNEWLSDDRQVQFLKEMGVENPKKGITLWPSLKKALSESVTAQA